jgi:hypothetical protein
VGKLGMHSGNQKRSKGGDDRCCRQAAFSNL